MVIMIGSYPSVNSYSMKKGNSMEKQDLKKRLKQEVESEASALERRVNTKKELASLKMPDDSYEELMKRISSKENARHKTIFFRNSPKKALATAVMAALMVTITGLGANAARLYLLKVENRENSGKPDIMIDTDAVTIEEINEEEAYERIEEEIGILALRIIDRPKGMELAKTYIDADMGEAMMEFCYQDRILSIYENKQNKSSSFNIQLDGKIVDTIETFYLGEELEILQIDKANGTMAYQVQIEYANAFYYLSGDLELEEFKNILYGVIFKNG